MKVFGSLLGAIGCKRRVGEECGARRNKNSHRIWCCPILKCPEWTASNLLRDIRALGPDAEGSVPVIAMTALVAQADRAAETRRNRFGVTTSIWSNPHAVFLTD